MSVTGIALAAGMGNRLGEITRQTPKPLLQVGDKTLLQRAVNFLHACHVDTVCVVGGYKFDEVSAGITHVFPDIQVVENTAYTLQNLLSFQKGLEIVPDDHDLLVCNADYVFKTTSAKRVAEQMTLPAVYCSYDLDGDEVDVMKVQQDEAGNVVDMSKQLTDFSSIYTGIFFFPAQYIAQIKDITAQLLATEDRSKATVEYVFFACKENGIPIQVADIGPADWFEIDTPEELVFARDHIGDESLYI